MDFIKKRVNRYAVQVAIEYANKTVLETLFVYSNGKSSIPGRLKRFYRELYGDGINISVDILGDGVFIDGICRINSVTIENDKD